MRDEDLWARRSIQTWYRPRVFDREGDLSEPSVPDEYRMRHRDGHIVWVRDEAALVADGSGELRWHGVIADITDRKLAEAELERRPGRAAVARLGERALEGTRGERPHARSAAHESDAHPRAARRRRARVRHRRSRRDPARRRWRGTADGPAGGPALAGARAAARRSRRADRRARRALGGALAWGAEGGRRTGHADVDFVQALANIASSPTRSSVAPAKTTSKSFQAVHDPLTALPNRVLFLDRFLAHALTRPAAKRGRRAARHRQLR